MANDLQTDSRVSVTALVTGIVHDIQDLLRQQFALFKHEIANDINKAMEAALSMALGVGLTILGALAFFLMLVHLLNWSTNLPLWGCYGIVAGVLFLLGGTLILAGKAKFESVHPLEDDSARALKENIQCLIHPK